MWGFSGMMGKRDRKVIEKHTVLLSEEIILYRYVSIMNLLN